MPIKKTEQKVQPALIKFLIYATFGNKICALVFSSDIAF